MFTVEDRDRVRDRVLALASSDPRVVTGGVVGSLARGGGDRWSDLDLTFTLADGVAALDVLADWSRVVVDELDAVQLFDLPSGSTIYRVFLLPGCLQLDLSFTPAPASEKSASAPRPADELFGYAVHHALRARVCIERGRQWQAEYWISRLREYALTLACRRRGLAEHYGRGFDDLPDEVLDRLAGALVRLLEREELLRALVAAVDGLLAEADEVKDMAAKLAPRLRLLTRQT